MTASPMPPSMHAHLDAPSLAGLWSTLRQRLEGSGHAVRGTVSVELGDDAADRVAGLLGRPVAPGQSRLRLTELDAALRSSAAGRGLTAVVAEVTGGPLRDLPGERKALRAGREQLWAHLDALLVDAGLARSDWVAPWTDGLHRGGVLTRLPVTTAPATLTVAVRTLALILPSNRPPVGLAELSTEVTGDAHGLDDGTPAAALVLGAVALALDLPPATSAAERRALWQRVGVSRDDVSGTVLTLALRPPGTDRWSAMMRERADLGLVTHLTVHELQRAAELTAPGEIVHACENPQVLQRFATAGVDRPLVCTSGNPAVAGSLLLDRVVVRYHGDFDWPGIAIARRIIGRGAAPWRLGCDDYLEAVDRLPADRRLVLSGRPEATPWDERLRPAMAAKDVAVHEEAIIDILIADLR